MIQNYEHTHQLSDIQQAMLDRTRHDYEDIINAKAKSAIFRTGMMWQTQAEKPTKYFLNLEKSRSGAKGMSCLITSGGTIEKSPKNILKEQKRYFEKLYSSDESVNFDYQNETDIRLTDIDSQNLDSPFTMEEMEQAIKDLSPNKACGCDGLPRE